MCFSLEWIEHLLILAVIVGAIIAILQVIVSFVLPKLPAPFQEIAGVISAIIRIVIWAIVIIAVIVFAFSVISCLWSYGGGILPHR